MKIQTLALAALVAVPLSAAATEVYICQQPPHGAPSLQDTPCEPSSDQLSHVPDYHVAPSGLDTGYEANKRFIASERNRKALQRERARVPTPSTSPYASRLREREVRMEQGQVMDQLNRTGSHGWGNYGKARAYGDMLNNQQSERNRLSR